MNPQTPPTTIQLYSPLASRDGTFARDSRLINGMVEQEGDHLWCHKRPGLQRLSLVQAGAGRGVHNWRGDIYSIFGSTLFKNGLGVGTLDPSEVYSFTSCLGATPKLFLKNTTHAYTYDATNGLVLVTDTDYPATTVPGCAYLDGTTYVLDNLNQILGSDFNDPQAWNPLTKLVVQIEPDAAVFLAKQLVYVVALKTISSEVFYDAGQAVGSPLAPVQGSKMNFGCRVAGSVCDVGGDLFWLATERIGSVKVIMMEQVKGRPISTPPVERLLSQLDYTTTWSWGMACGGHRFYVLTIVAANLTLVYDLTSKSWYQWTDTLGNYFPIVSSTFDSLARPILQHATDGYLYTADTTNYNDAGTPFKWEVNSPNFDGGVRTAKTLPLVEILGDWNPTSVYVSWSDDDFLTYTSPQPISMSQDRPIVQDGSSFRRRTYKLTNTDSTPLRIFALQTMPQLGTL